MKKRGRPFPELGKAGGGGVPLSSLPPAAAAQHGTPGAEALRGKGDSYGRDILGVGSAHRQALGYPFSGRYD